jgi:uncharacterized membrane protein
MKTLLRFVRTTFLSGALFLIPIAALAIIVEKAMRFILKFVKPLAKSIPDEFNVGLPKATLIAILVLAAACFLAGCWRGQASRTD